MISYKPINNSLIKYKKNMVECIQQDFLPNVTTINFILCADSKTYVILQKSQITVIIMFLIFKYNFFNWAPSNIRHTI